MPWARLDDAVLDNRKVLEAGPLGFALHVAAITWSARNLTDGFVPVARVSGLLNWEGVSVGGTPVSAASLVKTLLARELWHDVPGGYLIHDFLHYNPSREQVLGRREAGKKRAADRARTSRSLRAKPQRSSSRPVPVPVPVPETPKLTLVADNERIDASALLNLWNLHRGRLPRALALSKHRRSHAEARLRERSLVEWVEVIDRMSRSSFCRGETSRGWKADFTWLISSPDNALKVLEGKYDDEDEQGSLEEFNELVRKDQESRRKK